MLDTLSMRPSSPARPPLTVGDVHALPVLADARPEVIVNYGVDRQPVR
jgi:hypothetical protein